MIRIPSFGKIRTTVSGSDAGGRLTLSIPFREWGWPLFMLLSLTMMGLHFPLGYLLFPIILINRYKKNKYDFIIGCMFIIGGYALTSIDSTRLRMLYPALLFSFAGLLLYRKPPFLKKTIFAWMAYFAVLLAISMTSDEVFYEQLQVMWHYVSFIVFMIPVMVFAGERFDIMYFFRRVFQYAVIIGVFYILDAFIFCGNVLVPCSFIWWDSHSYFYKLYAYPLAGFHRKYPPGLYIIALCIFPVIRYYRLKVWHWLVLALALIATQTFTFISGVAVTFVIFQKNKKRVAAFMIAGVMGLVGAYFIDGMLPYHNDNTESFFRIKSSVDQLIDLQEVQDDEDLSKTGSGRLAQAIPKLELLYDLDREWLGLGFLSREGTSVRKYVIENEYYEDEEESIEVATNIEITVLQVLITVGYIGLLCHLLFYSYLYWIQRKLRFSGYFLSVLVAFAWFGIGGFEGWISTMSNCMLAMAFSAVFLANRDIIPGMNPIYKKIQSPGDSRQETHTFY